MSKNIDNFFSNLDASQNSTLALIAIIKSLPNIMSDVREMSTTEYEGLLAKSSTKFDNAELNSILCDIFKSMRAM